MSIFAKGPRLYELPDSLKRYLQDKGASGISYLTIVPFAFPVFVMNPFEYKDNFKETLLDAQTQAATTTISSAKVPAGEIWEINNVYGYSTVAGNMSIYASKAAVSLQLKYAAAENRIWWTGSIEITEGYVMKIGTSGVGGDMLIHTIGVKRYII